MIDGNELIEFFEGEYSQDVSADEVKRSIRDEFKFYAKEHQISIKSLNSAYNLFKRYKSGKETSNDMNDAAVLNDIVENYFVN